MRYCNSNIDRVCVDVKIPNVVRKQRAKSYIAVFIWLFQHSDQHALIELNASKIAKDLGFSRQQIYNAISFLKRVNLLKYKIYRTGRGNHSLVWLNWRKPEQKCQVLSKRTKSKNHIHDRPRPVQKTHREQTPWTRRMGAFRELIDQTTLVKSEREHSLCLIGKCVRTKSTEWARELYHRLAHRLYMLEPPNWVLEVRQFYAWLRSLINGLMEGVTA